MMTERVLVVGASGVVGSAVVKQLLQRGVAVRAATRDPAQAAGRIDPGAETVLFDFERPETFASALADVARVFLIARPGDEEPDRVAIPLIDEMQRQDVQHVVNLTAMGVETRDDLALRKVERCLEDSGLAFTHLRPNWFMQVFSGGPLLMDVRTTGALHMPAADARISYVHASDVSAVAAVALTESGHAGRAYTLTGPKALSHDEIAAAISQAAGRTVTYAPISEETARAAIVGAGLSPERAERLVEFYRLVRAGYCAPVSVDAEAVLGRRPASFAQFAAEYASCWR